MPIRKNNAKRAITFRVAQTEENILFYKVLKTVSEANQHTVVYASLIQNSMTHVKNTEAFARLIGFCKGYGESYNPGRPNLQIDALVNQLTEIQLCMEIVKVAKTNFDNEVNQRKQTFHVLPYLVASILRTLEASGAKPEKLKDARMFAHQLIGSSRQNRESIPSEKEGKSMVHRSQLQLAYVSKADTFSKLVKAVDSEPVYQPREKNFTAAGLYKKIQELNQLNRQVADARALWSKALIERNAEMYRKETSMIKTARAVKKYARAIFGLNSPQYILLKTLVFIKR